MQLSTHDNADFAANSKKKHSFLFYIDNWTTEILRDILTEAFAYKARGRVHCI